MDPVFFIGQFLIGASFALGAVSDIFERDQLLSLMKTKDLPLPGFLMYAGILIKLFAGIAIALDYHAKISAYVLALFVLIANFIFHNFWAYKGTQAKKEYIAFLTHVAIIGGLLTIFGA